MAAALALHSLQVAHKDDAPAAVQLLLMHDKAELRQGIPTLVLTAASGAELAAEADEGQQWGELWQHYPDVRRSPTGKPADPRVAAAVALALSGLSGSAGASNGSAAAAAGSCGFDWLIYGDDDVAFMWPGLLSMLEGLDPQQPYFLTDDLWSWWPRGIDPKKQWQTAPRADQPRCLPCSFNDTGLDLAATHAFKTCNCTVAAMADAFGQLLAPSADWLDFPAHPPYMSMDGGGGAVISIGLLRRLNATQYGRCIRGETGRTEVYGSDGLVTECVWQQGFGITDPGYELHHRGSFLFNAGGPQTSWRTLAAEAESALQGSGGRGVSTQQQERLLHMVSKHTDGGAMRNHREEAAHVARFLASMAQHAQRFSPPLEQLAKRLKP